MADLFKDIVPSILQTKKKVITQENEGDYVPFIVNKALSFHYDCVMYVNEMNKNSHLPKIMQFHYLLNTVRPYKRPFQKWQKRETVEDLEAIKEYYNYSYEKSKEALTVLSQSQLDEIKKELNKGGSNARDKRFNRGNSP